MLEIPR
jgi:hypothetical protein